MTRFRIWQAALVAAALAMTSAAPADAAPRRRPAAVAAQTPQAFMAQVLRRLNDSSAESLELPETTAWYDQSFLTLMQDNERLALARTDGPDLDYDPVCQCQENSGRYVLRGVTRRGEFADARMRMTFPGDEQAAGPNDYTIVLTRVAGAWRIWDVISEGRSVRSMLTYHNACLRARNTSRQLASCLAHPG